VRIYGWKDTPECGVPPQGRGISRGGGERTAGFAGPWRGLSGAARGKKSITNTRAEPSGRVFQSGARRPERNGLPTGRRRPMGGGGVSTHSKKGPGGKGGI